MPEQQYECTKVTKARNGTQISRAQGCQIKIKNYRQIHFKK